MDKHRVPASPRVDIRKRNKARLAGKTLSNDLLFKGGQGRTREDISHTSSVVGSLFILGCIATIIGMITMFVVGLS